jgi:hypothetical protein
VHDFVRPDPNKATLVDDDLRHPLHSGAERLAVLSRRLGLDAVEVAPLLGRRYRGDLFDPEGKACDPARW